MKPDDRKKPAMTTGQKRLLALVYGMGILLVGLFFFVMTMIVWQFAHLK